MVKPTSAERTLLEKLSAGGLSEEQVADLGARLGSDETIRSLIESAGLPAEALSRSLREKKRLVSAEAGRVIDRILAAIERMPGRPVNDATLDLPASGASNQQFDPAPSSSQGSAQLETARGDSEFSALAAKISSSKSGDDNSLRFDSFVVERELGQGGMGTVYLARDTRLDRLVAVKTLRRELASQPAAVERFLREARTAASLEHDHICPIYQVGESNGTPYIAMPFLKGEPLDAKIRREKLLSIPDVLRIGREIALGLTVAHEAGLIHRDIKPANIWLETMRKGPPRVRLLDFGLARAGTEKVHLTASGAILGTPAYMAPEQARGEAVDARADYWSLGVALYEMSTGRRPFTGNNTMAILSSLALDNPAPPHTVDPTVPVKLSELIMRLLVKDPQHRPSNGQQIADQFRQLQREALAAVAKPATPVVVPAPNARATPPAALAAPARPDDTMPADPFAGIDDVEPAPKKPLKKSLSGIRPAPAGKLAGVKTGGLPRWIKLLVPALALLWLAGGVAVYKLVFETRDGTLVVEVDGDAEVRFKDGKLEVSDPAGKTKYLLAPGEKPKPMAPGKYQVRVVGADGVKLDTEEFTIDRGGKTLVRVRAVAPAVAANTPKTPPKQGDPAPPAPTADPDRTAAEYLLSLGGVVSCNSIDKPIKVAAELPRKRFRLTGVAIGKECRIDDKGWELFRPCAHLEAIFLNTSNITDELLVNFKNSKKINLIGLLGTKVTDAGMRHFDGFEYVTNFTISHTAIGDAGIESLKKSPIGLIVAQGCQNITGSFLKSCNVEKLGHLDLAGCPFDEKNTPALSRIETPYFLNIHALGDESAALIAKMKFSSLHFWGCKFTDKGMAALGGSQSIKFLGVNASDISKAGVTGLRTARKLRDLVLVRTNLTPDDVAEFRKALPLCKVTLNDQVLDPTPRNPEANRKAAEYVISVGGTVQINTDGARITTLEQLPKKPFWVSGVYFGGNKKAVTDEGLVVFADCEDIEVIDFSFISQKNVTTAGLAHFQKCKNLVWLDLQGIPVTDEGLAIFRGFPDLGGVGLNFAKITDAGLEHLSTCPSLSSVGFPWTPGPTDKGLLLFKNRLRGSLNIAATNISDESMGDHLSGLDLLWIGRTKVSIDGLRRLKLAKNIANLHVNENPNIDDRCVQAIVDQFPKLAQLNLTQCPVTDDSLKLIARHPRLYDVNFCLTKITDAGLEHLKGMTGLRGFSVQQTAVTDAGLDHLKGMTDLRFLNVQQTAVTEAKLKELHEALPWCTIHWDGGKMEPE